MFKGTKVLTMVFCFSLLSFAQLFAQEETAAGVYNDGLAMLKEKSYAEGLQLMEKALELATEGEDEKVIELAKKNGSIAAYNVGNEMRKQKNYEDAAMYYGKGIEMNPEYPSNYAGKAVALKSLNRNPEAVTAFMEAGDLYGDDESKAGKMYKQAEILVGQLYTSDMFAEAVIAGKTYLENRRDADVSYYVARSYEKQEDYTNALSYINRSLETAGDDAKDKYYVAQAAAYEGLNQIPDAIEAYKKVSGEKYMEHAQYKIETLSNR